MGPPVWLVEPLGRLYRLQRSGTMSNASGVGHDNSSFRFRVTCARPTETERSFTSLLNLDSRRSGREESRYNLWIRVETLPAARIEGQRPSVDVRRNRSGTEELG